MVEGALHRAEQEKAVAGIPDESIFETKHMEAASMRVAWPDMCSVNALVASHLKSGHHARS